MVEFRLNFLFDIITMFLVNLLFYGSILYLAYSNNGFGEFSFNDIIMSVTIMQLAFIVGIGFFRGMDTLQSSIITGEFDKILVRPINSYFHILISEVNLKIIGEIVSLIILLFLNNPINIPFILVFGIFSAVIFNLSLLLFQCIPFFTDMNNEIDFFDLVLGFSNYPPSIFNSFMKFLGFFIFPGLMISFGPIMILKNPSFAYVYFGFIAILITAFVIVFNLGLKRYRSAGY
jgi:ABC-2 type transport system permease protein